jgi:hypothetical protein
MRFPKDIGAWLAAGAALVVGIVASRKPRYSYGRPDGPNGISRDPGLLLPSFAARVELLFQRMRKRRFDPVLHEGFRTRARAEMLSRDPDGPGPRKAPGIPHSMHIYGAAVDVISASRGYEHPAFFTALGEEAKRLGLTWGGDFGDRPHVQAIPYTSRAQNGLRAAAVHERDAYVRRWLA